ncbi:hypothetical protein [Cytobacillus horneckiae]|nr:hypothetical protein [Cytobacillus horneckiae]
MLSKFGNNHSIQIFTENMEVVIDLGITHTRLLVENDKESFIFYRGDLQFEVAWREAIK